ncbi:hypothetical protein Pst134EB_012061 [Puccinia striiformis f. sp. tritici]|nr:hypothetical protein Pst134EB_012061 [Puccinia striiformis f. sp. tritici]
MAKPSSIPRKAFRATSSHHPPSSPLRPKVLPRPELAPQARGQAEDDHHGKRREEEDEEEDDFNPFTSHKSNEATASTTSARRKSQGQPLQAESSLWLFDDDRGADSTNIMQTVMAPWDAGTFEDEDTSFAHLEKKLQRNPTDTNREEQHNVPVSSTRAQVLSPVNDMVSRLLSPTHKLTRQLYSTSNTTRRPLSSHNIVSSQSSNVAPTTTSTTAPSIPSKATQVKPTHQSPAAPCTSNVPSDQAAEVSLRPVPPPPSALKNHRGPSVEPPKSLKKARFADPDENFNQFTQTTSGCTESYLPADAAPVPDPFQGLASPPITSLYTKQNSAASTSVLPKQNGIKEPNACPSNDQQTGNPNIISKPVNQTQAPSSGPEISAFTSAPARYSTTSEAHNLMNSSPIRGLPTPLSPDRPLASRLQASSSVRRSNRALSVERLSVNPAGQAKVSDPMEKIKTQQKPLTSFKRLSRTNSANSKVFQTIQTAPTTALHRASSVSNVDMLRPSRVVRPLASLSGDSEPDPQVVHEHPNTVSEPHAKTVEAQSDNSIQRSSDLHRLDPNDGKNVTQLPPYGEPTSSESKNLPNPREDTNMSSEDESPQQIEKASTSGDSTRNSKAAGRRPSNRIHVSERAGSRLSALMELPTPNSTVEAINSGDLEGVPICSNLSMVCQNGGIPQFSTPYATGPVSLPLPPDTIHLSASRPRRSGRKSLNGNRNTPSKLPLVPLTFGDLASNSPADPNHTASSIPVGNIASPPRNVADLPVPDSISRTAGQSHSTNRTDTANATSTVAPNANVAPENFDLKAPSLPFSQVKKVKAKSADRSIGIANPTLNEARSSALKKGSTGQANVVGSRPFPDTRADQPSLTMNSKANESAARQPSSSICKPSATAQKESQQEERPITTMTSTIPLDAREEATVALAPASRLIRVKRPSLLDVDSDSAISKKSRVPSASTGELSQVSSNKNQPTAPTPLPTTTATSASDARHPSAVNPLAAGDTIPPACRLVRVKRPSALDADCAPAFSKKSRVPSPTTISSTSPSDTQAAGNPPSTSSSTAQIVLDARPLSPAHAPEDLHAVAPPSHLVRVKRPAGLDTDSTSALSKNSCAPSVVSDESSQVPSNQSAAQDPLPTSNAKPAPHARPPSPSHHPKATDVTVPAARLVRAKRPSVLDGGSASVAPTAPTKSHVSSAPTGESSRVLSDQSRAGNTHRTSAEAARTASDAKLPSPPHRSAVPDASRPVTQLIRVKRPSANDVDSASAVPKKSRVPSAGAGEPSRPPGNQPKVGIIPAKSSSASRKPPSSHSRPRVTSKTHEKSSSSRTSDDASRQKVDTPQSSVGLLPSSSNNPERTEAVGESLDLPARSALIPAIELREGQPLDLASTQQSGGKDSSIDNPQRTRLQRDKSIVVNVAPLPDAIRASSEGWRVEATGAADPVSAIKPRASSADRRCTVLLEAPSDFDPGHAVVDTELPTHRSAQPVLTSGHDDLRFVQPSEPSGGQSSSSATTTNHETAGLKGSLNRKAPILTLPKEFDFAFRSTLPSKPRIKDARAQTVSSTQTVAPSRRAPLPTTSQTKSSARPKSLTRSRPDDVDADRAPKRIRNNQSIVASPARKRVGPTRPGLNNRVRNVVGRLNNLAKNAPAPVPSAFVRNVRHKPSQNPQRVTGGSTKIVGRTSQSAAAPKTSQPISEHINRVAPIGSAHQTALRNQLMREIRQKQGRSASNSDPPASRSSSENMGGKHSQNRCLADIPETSQPAPRKGIQRNVSGASSSKEQNPPRFPEVRRNQIQSVHNSRPASSGFQSCLNQWREVEARQSTSSLQGSLSNSVQARNLPEWQDVSLVHHVLPVKDHSKPRKPMISFGLATEKRILERENWEQTRAHKEKIEAEIKAQQDLKALEIQREQFIKMRKDCVVKANPVPAYLKKNH